MTSEVESALPSTQAGPASCSGPAPVGANAEPVAIRVVLPAHLRNLAGINGELQVDVNNPPTMRSALDALEAAYPVLRGTVRDQTTQRRRAFVRFFACEQDLSHSPPDEPLPPAVVAGKEPLLIVGAMAGG